MSACVFLPMFLRVQHGARPIYLKAKAGILTFAALHIAAQYFLLNEIVSG